MSDKVAEQQDTEAPAEAEEAPPAPVVLDRDAFRASLRMGEAVEIVHGCRVRGLAAREYQRLQAGISEILQSIPPGAPNREELFRAKSTCLWLSLAVAEPKLMAAEWEMDLEHAKVQMIEDLVAAAKRLTLGEGGEVAAAKKAFAAILGG